VVLGQEPLGDAIHEDGGIQRLGQALHGRTGVGRHRRRAGQDDAARRAGERASRLGHFGDGDGRRGGRLVGRGRFAGKLPGEHAAGDLQHGRAGSAEGELVEQRVDRGDQFGERVHAAIVARDRARHVGVHRVGLDHEEEAGLGVGGFEQAGGGVGQAGLGHAGGDDDRAAGPGEGERAEEAALLVPPDNRRDVGEVAERGVNRIGPVTGHAEEVANAATLERFEEQVRAGWHDCRLGHAVPLPANAGRADRCRRARCPATGALSHG
jgi:hypothetical protein